METLSSLRGRSMGEQPRIFDLSDPNDRAQVTAHIATGDIRYVSDDYREQLRELYAIDNPSTVYAPDFAERFEAHLRDRGSASELDTQGRWVYFPWRSQLVHILEEDSFYRVRTARNQHLITKEEQRRFYDARIGIAGLSVGSAVAFALVLQGGGKRMRLADMDRLALTNINRIVAGVDRIGELKVVMAARTIYELDPYAEIELFREGITKDNVASFFDGLDIVIDEIDDLSVKCLIREQARGRRVPIVMAADNGDNAVVDIERYDRDPELEYFHGRMGKVSYDSLRKLDKVGIGKLITKLVGPENVTPRMQQSLLEMGKSIVSWPQLGGAALLNGAAVAYCVRKIINEEPLETDRALVSLDEKLIPGYASPAERRKRADASKTFAENFDLN